MCTFIHVTIEAGVINAFVVVVASDSRSDTCNGVRCNIDGDGGGLVSNGALYRRNIGAGVVAIAISALSILVTYRLYK